MMLLDLPIELLELILDFLTPDAFYVILFVCRHLRHLASTSRPLLLRQMSRIAGFTDSLQASDDQKSIFANFQALARHHLLAIDIFSHPHFCYIDPRLKVQKSILISSWDTVKVVLCFKHEPGIELHVLRYPHSLPLGRIELPSVIINKQIPADWFGDYEMEKGNWEVCQIAVAKPESEHMPPSSDLFGVLYQMKSQAYHGEPSSPFDEGEPDAVRHYRLIVHEVAARYNTENQRSMFISTPKWERVISMKAGNEALALGLGRRGVAAISWRHFGRRDISRIFLYHLADDSVAPLELRPGPESEPPGLISRLEFANDSKRLNLYQQGLPIFGFYCKNCRSADVVQRSSTVRTNGPVGRFNLQVGMPFAGLHEHFGPLAEGQDEYLMLGFQWTDRGPAAYVVRGSRTTRPRQDNPGMRSVELDHPANTIHGKPVARLRKFVQGRSSLGTLVTASPTGNLLAMSYWARGSYVLIWKISPLNLLHSVDVARQLEAGEEAGEEPEMLVLDPVVLRVSAAIHHLRFAGEHSLWAVSDQGIIHWDLVPDPFSKKGSTSTYALRMK